MTAQEYIISTLQELAESTPTEDIGDQSVEDAIFAKVMSKKFRKYSVTPEYLEHVKRLLRKMLITISLSI